MAANVLNSTQAIEMSVHIVRTFIRLREAAMQSEELSRRLSEVEKHVGKHDIHLAGIVRKIREMSGSQLTQKKKTKIGFIQPEEDDQKD